jgi:hypothetical protein
MGRQLWMIRQLASEGVVAGNHLRLETNGQCEVGLETSSRDGGREQ